MSIELKKDNYSNINIHEKPVEQNKKKTGSTLQIVAITIASLCSL
jgi:hypothetical protein